MINPETGKTLYEELRELARARGFYPVPWTISGSGEEIEWWTRREWLRDYYVDQFGKAWDRAEPLLNVIQVILAEELGPESFLQLSVLCNGPLEVKA